MSPIALTQGRNNFVKDDPAGPFTTAIYKQGYAVGQIVYDKHGVAIESGTLNNVRLKHVFNQIGSTRALMTAMGTHKTEA